MTGTKMLIIGSMAIVMSENAVRNSPEIPGWPSRVCWAIGILICIVGICKND